MNIPNLITIVAARCIVPIVIVMIGQERWGTGALLLFVASRACRTRPTASLPAASTCGPNSALIIDPLADKALLVSIYVTLAVDRRPARPGSPSMVVSRDIMIVAAILVSRLMDRPVEIKPLLVSKLNTAAQIAFAGIILGMLAFSLDAPSRAADGLGGGHRGRCLDRACRPPPTSRAGCATWQGIEGSILAAPDAVTARKSLYSGVDPGDVSHDAAAACVIHSSRSAVAVVRDPLCASGDVTSCFRSWSGAALAYLLDPVADRLAAASASAGSARRFVILVLVRVGVRAPASSCAVPLAVQPDRQPSPSSCRATCSRLQVLLAEQGAPLVAA